MTPDEMGSMESESASITENTSAMASKASFSSADISPTKFFYNTMNANSY